MPLEPSGPVEEARFPVAAVGSVADLHLQLPAVVLERPDVGGVIGMPDHAPDADVVLCRGVQDLDALGVDRPLGVRPLLVVVARPGSAEGHQDGEGA